MADQWPGLTVRELRALVAALPPALDDQPVYIEGLAGVMPCKRVHAGSGRGVFTPDGRQYDHETAVYLAITAAQPTRWDLES